GVRAAAGRDGGPAPAGPPPAPRAVAGGPRAPAARLQRDDLAPRQVVDTVGLAGSGVVADLEDVQSIIRSYEDRSLTLDNLHGSLPSSQLTARVTLVRAHLGMEDV